jgi:hypothetical protein
MEIRIFYPQIWYLGIKQEKQKVMLTFPSLFFPEEIHET